MEIKANLSLSLVEVEAELGNMIVNTLGAHGLPQKVSLILWSSCLRCT